MRKALLLLWLGVALGSGCQATDVAWHRATFAITEHQKAEKAWRDRRWMYDGVPCPVSFKAGFVAGYRFARGGYDSCEPPTPKHYWRINGITDEDRLRAGLDGRLHTRNPGGAAGWLCDSKRAGCRGRTRATRHA